MSHPKSTYTLEEIFHYKDKSDETKKVDHNEARRLTTLKFDNTTLKSDISLLKENIKRYEKSIANLQNSHENNNSESRKLDWPPRIETKGRLTRVPPAVDLGTTSGSSSKAKREIAASIEYLHSLTKQLRHFQSTLSSMKSGRNAEEFLVNFSPSSSSTSSSYSHGRRGAIDTSFLNQEETRNHQSANNKQDFFLRETLFRHTRKKPVHKTSHKEFEDLLNQKNKLLTEKEELREELRKIKIKYEKERSKPIHQQSGPSEEVRPTMLAVDVLESSVANYPAGSSEDDDDEDDDDTFADDPEEWAEINEEDKEHWEDISGAVEENFI